MCYGCYDLAGDIVASERTAAWATDLGVHHLPIEVAHRYRTQGPQEHPELTEQIRSDGGMREPIVLNTDGVRGYIHDGHHRLDSASSLGMTHVPVRVNRINEELTDYPPLDAHVHGILQGRTAAAHPPLPALWRDYQGWHHDIHGPDPEYTPHDSVQSWGNVEEYLNDRHDLPSHDPSTYDHPTTLGMAKLHSLAQGRPQVDGQSGTEHYMLNDDDLTTGAALGLLKIRRNNLTKRLEPYEAQRRMAMPAQDAYDSGQGPPGTPDVHPGPWYHSSDHDLPDGTILTPGGGKSQWSDLYDDGRQNRANWVWMGKDPHATSNWGTNTYEVEPLDEGPWPWNGYGGEGHVSPRARIVKRLGGAWDGTTAEPSTGWKASTTPFIARGINLSHPEHDHDMFHAINEGRATPEHMKKLLGKGNAGIWWGTYSHPDSPDPHAYGNFDSFDEHSGAGANPNESVAGYIDGGEYHDRLHNDHGGDYSKTPIFAEVPVVMVGKRPMRGDAQWDPELHNPSDPLMGNSYLDDDEPIDLHEIHYHNGRDWHTVPMTGHRVTAELIKHKIPADRNWLDEDSVFDEYDDVPATPVDYSNHDDSVSGDWFHVAPQPLKPGTKIIPGGGKGLHDTAPENWDSSGPLGNRRDHVWLAPNIDKAMFWQSQLGEGARIHHVKPGAKPQPWNMTGSEGFVAPHAHVIGDVTDWANSLPPWPPE